MVQVQVVQAFAVIDRSSNTHFFGNSIGSGTQQARRQRVGQTLLTMRDMSASYWFSVGDTVEVIEDVFVNKGTINLKGRRGIVKETWEKCDVDPTCCCAEQVDPNMAVRVEFVQTNNDPKESTSTTAGSANDSDSFLHYFAEEELIKIPVAATATTPVSAATTSVSASKATTTFQSDNHITPEVVVQSENVAADQVPFDGMSCVAFKLDQLKSSDKPRNLLTQYDPNNNNNAKQ